MQQQRLCNNCRHFRNDVSNFQKCTLRKTSPKFDPVNGKTIPPKYEYASVMRLAHEDCGADGALYEFEADPMKRTWNARIDDLTTNALALCALVTAFWCSYVFLLIMKRMM